MCIALLRGSDYYTTSWHRGGCSPGALLVSWDQLPIEICRHSGAIRKPERLRSRSRYFSWEITILGRRRRERFSGSATYRNLQPLSSTRFRVERQVTERWSVFASLPVLFAHGEVCRERYRRCLVRGTGLDLQAAYRIR